MIYWKRSYFDFRSNHGVAVVVAVDTGAALANGASMGRHCHLPAVRAVAIVCVASAVWGGRPLHHPQTPHQQRLNKQRPHQQWPHLDGSVLKNWDQPRRPNGFSWTPMATCHRHNHVQLPNRWPNGFSWTPMATCHRHNPARDQSKIKNKRQLIKNICFIY